ncbi:MAG: hypothetical protein L0H96_07700 [Humibacillus sp.]|nr:hypothetical protein [Humibacillus sp.]MDN5776776.1 hypothetical protein [Humibacillus sp.]
MTDPDHPPSSPEVTDGLPGERFSLADEAPLARGALVVSLVGVVFGFTFLPQLVALALAGLSLARGERAGRRYALLAIVLSLVLTIVWGIALGLMVTWWATTRIA